MVTRLGTRLGTSLGTDLGEFAENPPPATFDASKMYALSDFTATAFYQTAQGGGEPGAATGFGYALLARPRDLLASGTQKAFVRLNNPGGYQEILSVPTRTSSNVWNGSSYPTTGYRTIPGSDVGRAFVIVARITATPGVYEYYVNRVLVSSAAHASYAAPAGTTRTYLGAEAGTLPASAYEILSVVTFTGVPSQAQIEAYFDAARAAGDLPTTMAGATVTHVTSLRRALLGPNVPVADGAAAPASLPDAITNATIDRMDRQGAPTVRVIDPSLYPRTSYGAMGALSEYQSAQGVGIRGVGGIFTVGFDIAFAGGTSFNVGQCGDGAGNGGWSVYGGATTITLRVRDGAATSITVNATPALNVRQRFAARSDGSTISLWANGALVASQSITGYTAPTGTQRMTLLSQYLTNATPVYWLGGGDYAATDNELIAWTRAQGRVTASIRPGSDQHVYDLTQDVVAGGGPSAAPATVLDRVGTDHLARLGTGMQVSQRTEQLFSYETTPVFRGADALTNAHYFESTHDDATLAGTSFFNAFLYFIPYGNTSSGVSAGATSLALPNTGWDLRFATNNATANWFFGDGTSFATSGNAILAQGKLNLLVCVWDQPALRQRLYANRAEVGTGTARSAYAPTGAGTKINLGRSPRDVASATGARTLLGYAQGTTLLGLLQVQALFDAVMASESMLPFTSVASTVVDLTADVVANGGAIPASLANRAGAGAFTRNGTPTLATYHARAFSW